MLTAIIISMPTREPTGADSLISLLCFLLLVAWLLGRFLESVEKATEANVVLVAANALAQRGDPYDVQWAELMAKAVDLDIKHGRGRRMLSVAVIKKRDALVRQAANA